VLTRYAHLDEPDFSSDSFALGVGATRIYSDELSVELGFNFEYADSTDDLGARSFAMLTAPAKATWDRRDDKLDATSGTFLEANVMPFLGLNDTASGLRTHLDGRLYRSLGAETGVVLAGRLQLGSVLGPDQQDVRPEDLFFSGGGGTVRGQPYQSLNVDLGGGTEIGGRSFLGASAEIRARVSDKFGAVAFVDTGYVGPESLYDGSGDWHAGAGLGVRYNTGLGPIRFDVAAPVSGSTGDGVQLYLGLGQAF
jgi:translocation and assembly module TamA